MHSKLRFRHRIFRTITLGIVLLATAAVPVVAQEEEGWKPQPPMPSKFDWMQMTSGEWLKGEFISMYDGDVEFDSDEFDLQTVDWDDVREFRSVGTMQVAFEDGTIAVGQLLIDDETVRVMGADDREFPRAGLLSITAGEPREINYWDMKASIGANLREGNTEQIETTGRINLIRRTPKDRIMIDYLATFNQTDGETAADNQRLNIGWNRYLSKRFYLAPIQAEWFRDPFINIASRYTLGVGAGYDIIDTGKITWDVTGGLAYQTTSFDSVIEGEEDSADTPALWIGTLYDHELTKWIDFLFAYNFMFTNEESGTYTHHLETGLEFELTRLFDFDITLIWDRIQDPRPDSDGIMPAQDDYRLVFFLGLDF
jgi:hypothetical protein